MTTQVLSPMMQQWHDLKSQQKEALLLFRLGDFYEAFYEDATILSDILDITLTKRQDIPMSGIPYHSSASYLDILLARGYKVAIAEQIDNPKEVKGLVRREIVKILSPGAHTGSASFDDRKHHFITLCHMKKSSFCICWLDVSLNEAHFQFADSLNEMLDLLALISPKELLIGNEVKTLLDGCSQLIPSSVLYSESCQISHKDLCFYEDLIKEHFQ